MDNIQLCVAIGVPIVFNGIMFTGLVVTGTPWMKSLGSRMSGIESRMIALENTGATRCDLILERLADFDTRLARLAERSHAQ
jgi:hypothetical protein